MQADAELFKQILHNPTHVLYRFLPLVKTDTRNFRTRAQNLQLPLATAPLGHEFIYGELYHGIY